MNKSRELVGNEVNRISNEQQFNSEIRVTRGRSHPILYLSLRVVERAEILPEVFETSDD